MKGQAFSSSDAKRPTPMKAKDRQNKHRKARELARELTANTKAACRQPIRRRQKPLRWKGRKRERNRREKIVNKAIFVYLFSFYKYFFYTF